MATKPKSDDDAAPDAMVEIEAQLAALRIELAALASTLAALSRSGPEAVKQAAAEVIDDLKASDPLAEAENRVTAVINDVSDYARTNPLQSMGIAAGIGMILGLLFGRR